MDDRKAHRNFHSGGPELSSSKRYAQVTIVDFALGCSTKPLPLGHLVSRCRQHV